MSKISEEQLLAFHDELEKLGSKWYANLGKRVADFGKRQLHGVTGWTPKGYMSPKGIEEIGAGAADASETPSAGAECRHRLGTRDWRRVGRRDRSHGNHRHRA